MSKETENTEELSGKEFEKLIDWGLQTQLTWSVIFLTCFIGLIELLPVIPRFDLSYSPSQAVYLLFLGVIYAFLVGGFAYSIHRTAKIIHWNFEWARRIPQSKLSASLYHTRGRLINILFSKYGKVLVWIAISMLIFAWTTIFVLKVLFVP